MGNGKPRRGENDTPKPTKVRRIVHGQPVWVTVLPPAWADGASRQTIGRFPSKRLVKGKLK